MAAGTTLLEVGAMFAAIAVAGAVARRAGQSVIPFYILVGMVAGPHVLGDLGLPHVAEGDFVALAAELGIVFLLFFLGLEFSLDRLLAGRVRIGRAGTVDLLINFPAGVLLGLALGWSVLQSLVLAGIVYISSSAVITKALIDLGWIANDEAEPMLGTLVFEDLFIAIYLAVVSAVVIGGGEPTAAADELLVATAFLLALLGAVYAGTGLIERLLAVDSVELTVLRTVAITVFVAGAALALGISEAVAAFFVGMGVSGTDRVGEIEELLVPVRDVFAAVFFFWIGLVTDPGLFADVAWLVAAAVVLTTPTKLASGFLGGRIYGLDDRRSVRVACGMVARGEFSLIIATVAAAGAGPIMRETIPAFAVGYVLVMSVLGTVLMQYSAGVYAAFRRVRPAAGPEPTPGSD